MPRAKLSASGPLTRVQYSCISPTPYENRADMKNENCRLEIKKWCEHATNHDLVMTTIERIVKIMGELVTIIGRKRSIKANKLSINKTHTHTFKDSFTNHC